MTSKIKSSSVTRENFPRMGVRLILDLGALKDAGYTVVDEGPLDDGSPCFVVEGERCGAIFDMGCLEWMADNGISDQELDAFVDEIGAKVMTMVLSKIALRVR